MVAHSVVRLECEKSPYRLVLENGKPLEARSVVIASGAQYNNPENLNLERFVGQGVYYGATFMEAQLCESEDLIVVGGGNSAGQAAVFLAQTAAQGSHASTLATPFGQHVALPDPANRGESRN